MSEIQEWAGATIAEASKGEFFSRPLQLLVAVAIP